MRGIKTLIREARKSVLAPKKDTPIKGTPLFVWMLSCLNGTPVAASAFLNQEGCAGRAEEARLGCWSRRME